MGEIYFPFPVAKFDRNVVLREIQNMLSSASYSPCIPIMIKSCMICEFFEALGFQVWDFFYNCHVFLADKYPCVGYP